MQIKLYKFLIFISCIIFFACGTKATKSIQKQYSQELVNSYLNEVSRKYHFSCEGVKWGMYGGILRLIGPRFLTKSKIDIPTARQLILELSGNLITKVNDCDKLRPYLKNYPFTTQNVEVALSYVGKSPTKNGEITYCVLINGIIYYQKVDPETDKYKVIYKENYNEAVEKLKVLNSEKRI